MQVRLAGGHILTEITTVELVTQVDAIISVPVMKTHDQGQITLSLKTLQGLVTDGDKRRIHLEGMFEGATDLVAHFSQGSRSWMPSSGRRAWGRSSGCPWRWTWSWPAAIWWRWMRSRAG